jgi:hypothetical protein
MTFSIALLSHHIPAPSFYYCLSFIPCWNITPLILSEHIYRLKAWNIYRKSNIYHIISSKKFHDFLWSIRGPYVNDNDELYFEYMDIDCILTLYLDTSYFIITFW